MVGLRIRPTTVSPRSTRSRVSSRPIFPWAPAIATRMTGRLPELLGRARDTLDRLQTEIAHYTTEPWPSRPGRGYRGGLSVPRAELVEGRLHLWLGPRDHPVLQFALAGLRKRDPARLRTMQSDAVRSTLRAGCAPNRGSGIDALSRVDRGTVPGTGARARACSCDETDAQTCRSQRHELPSNRPRDPVGRSCR